MITLYMVPVPCNAFRAYDCLHMNSNFSTVSLADVEHCPSRNDQSIILSNHQIQIVQEKEWSYLHVYHCSVNVIKNIHYCGMHSHISSVHTGLQSYLHDVSKSDCMGMISNGQILLEGHLISGLKSNSSMNHHITLAGIITDSGQCEGTSYIYAGKQYQSAIVQATIEINLKDYNTVFEISSQTINFNDGTVCPYDEGECIHPVHGNTFWESSQMEDCGMKSRDVLYEGPSTVSGTSKDMQINSVLSVNKGTSLFSLIIKGYNHVCHQRAYSTDHARIYIIKRESYGYYFQPSIINPRDVNLALYMNSKISYAVHHIEMEIKELYRELTSRDCEIERKGLINKLSIVRHHPMSFGNIMNDKPGYYNVIAGEILYTVKCQAVDVKYRKSNICTAHLPVTYANQSMYMEPVARILTNTSYEVPCSPLTPPGYHMSGQWYSFSPKPQLISNPSVISPTMKDGSLKYRSIQGLMTSGLYDNDVMTRFQQFISFPMIKTEANSYVASKLTNSDVYESSIMDSFYLFDERALERMGDKIKGNLFKTISIFGSLAGSIWGIIMLYKIVSKIISMVINSLSLYKMFGCTKHLWASPINSMTQYILHFNQPKDMPDENNHADEGDSHVNVSRDHHVSFHNNESSHDIGNICYPSIQTCNPHS